MWEGLEACDIATGRFSSTNIDKYIILFNIRITFN
jgi:hypothetical protein